MMAMAIIVMLLSELSEGGRAGGGDKGGGDAGGGEGGGKGGGGEGGGGGVETTGVETTMLTPGMRSASCALIVDPVVKASSAVEESVAAWTWTEVDALRAVCVTATRLALGSMETRPAVMRSARGVVAPGDCP